MKNRSSNDQRSDVKNPTSGDYQKNADNRSGQLNPQDERFGSSREGSSSSSTGQSSGSSGSSGSVSDRNTIDQVDE